MTLLGYCRGVLSSFRRYTELCLALGEVKLAYGDWDYCNLMGLSYARSSKEAPSKKLPIGWDYWALNRIMKLEIALRDPASFPAPTVFERRWVREWTGSLSIVGNMKISHVQIVSFWIGGCGLSGYKASHGAPKSEGKTTFRFWLKFEIWRLILKIWFTVWKSFVIRLDVTKGKLMQPTIGQI